MFESEFGNKIKFNFYNNSFNNKNKYFNKNMKKKMKVYLINIIILTKCIDIITSMTSGAFGTFIFSKGFRNKIIYNFGFYK